MTLPVWLAQMGSGLVWLAQIATPVVIGGGFYWGYRQLKATRNARMAGIILSITERWDSPHMHKCRLTVNQYAATFKDKMEEFDKSNSAELYDLATVGNFFDGLGLLVMEGFLRSSMAYNLVGPAAEHYYKLYEPVLEAEKYKHYFEYFQKLHEVFRKEEARHFKTEPGPIG